MFLARRIDLDPKRVYEVRFFPDFVDELEDHPSAEELLDEIDHDLGIDEAHLRRGAITKVAEHGPVALYRYKPKADTRLRILFSPRGNVRDVVMSIPRKTDYRKGDLQSAIKRVQRVRAEVD